MRRIFLIIAVLAVVATPLVADAASFLPVVPCGRVGQPPCTPCSLFEGVKRITDLILFGITGPIAAFMVVLAGGMMLLGGANPGQFSRGKTLLTNTLIGVTIILLSWVATNFLIKSVATGSDGDEWFEFTCPQFLTEFEQDTTEVTGGVPTGLPPAPAPTPRPPGTSEESWYAALAAAQVPPVPFPRKNSPTLTSLVNCIYNDPVVAALAKPKPNMSGSAAQSGIFTYDNSHTVCNYTRGKTTFSSCSHGSNGSCHYGGKRGTNGAEAVDMNSKDQNVTVPGLVDERGQPVPVYASEERLWCELYRVLVTQNKCGDFKFINFEGDHTHVSTRACDGDGQGAGQVPRKACSPIVTTRPSSGGQ